jgi:hypothetical protein
MKFLILIVLLPIVLLGALRMNLTPFRLLSASEYDEMQKTNTALQNKIKTLESQVEQLRQNPKISDGSWMRDPSKGSALTPKR